MTDHDVLELMASDIPVNCQGCRGSFMDTFDQNSPTYSDLCKYCNVFQVFGGFHSI